MAKKKAKKKKAKKKAKKKTTKKATKKTVKKTVKKAAKKKHYPLHQIRSLHAKKLQIMSEVAVIPCSAISKDRYGLMYAHTQAEKIFQLYAEKCRQAKLVVRMIECVISSIKYPDILRGVESDLPTSVDSVLAVCKFEIRDTESSETETFMGAGLGDNHVWSANSAQTVAMKQALIQYFFTAWPQPTDYCEVIRKELAGLKGEEFYKAIKKMLPEKPIEPLTQSVALKELVEYFAGPIKKPKEKS